MSSIRRTIILALLALAACAIGSAAHTAAAVAAIDYQSISFVDAKHGCVAGFNNDTTSDVWRTTDAGATWSRVDWSPLAGGGVGWVSFASATTGLWGNGSLKRTTDGGGHWVDVAVTPITGYVAEADFATVSRGWAVSTNGSSAAGGQVARTSDGGATWTVQYTKLGSDGSGGFAHVSAPTAKRCYAFKWGRSWGVYATANAGASWRRRVPPKFSSTTRQYCDIDFPAARTGWAVGDGGRIVKTGNAGASWAKQKSHCTVRLNAVDFVNVKTGYVVGDGGCVLRTTDGGKHWKRLATGTKQTLRAVCFVDARHGWVAGRNVLLRTTNGGKTWMAQN